VVAGMAVAVGTKRPTRIATANDTALNGVRMKKAHWIDGQLLTERDLQELRRDMIGARHRADFQAARRLSL
jgi:hypothetical protein